MESEQRVSFIVRLRVEQAETEPRRAVWEGEIEHVISHEKNRVENLAGIGDFIRPYLERMGVRFRWQCRLRAWLRRSGL